MGPYLLARKNTGSSQNLSPMKELPIKITRGKKDKFYSIKIDELVENSQSKKKKREPKGYTYLSTSQKLNQKASLCQYISFGTL
jgi:hypothetical protein